MRSSDMSSSASTVTDMHATLLDMLASGSGTRTCTGRWCHVRCGLRNRTCTPGTASPRSASNGYSCTRRNRGSSSKTMRRVLLGGRDAHTVAAAARVLDAWWNVVRSAGSSCAAVAA